MGYHVFIQKSRFTGLIIYVVLDGFSPSRTLDFMRYEPDTDGPDPTPQTAIQGTPGRFQNMRGLPSPPAALFESLKEQSRSRNGSRDRKPEGLQIQLPPIEQTQDLIATGVARHILLLKNKMTPLWKLGVQRRH